MRRFDSYSPESLRQAYKFELFSQVSDCSEIDDHELESILFELACRLSSSATQRDRKLFFLLACSRDLKQINFGTGMLSDFVEPAEAIPYWVAVNELARAPFQEKNVARNVARIKIQRFFGILDQEQLEEKIEELRTEHQIFIGQLAQAMTGLD